MAETTVNLGMLPQNRGEYSSSATYYKDNIVQYNGSSYICTAAMDLEHPSGITGVAPYNSDPATPNTGWAVFSNDSSGVGEGVYNVSVDHTTDNQPKVYASLSAALQDVPQAKKKGGMSVKFVLSSDNKYVQYRLMLSTFTAAQFVNAANWQGVDAVPTPESKNTVESGGVTDYAEKAVLSNSGKFNILFKEFYMVGQSFAMTDVTSLYIDKGKARSGGVYRTGITLKVGNTEVFTYYEDKSTQEEAVAVFKDKEINVALKDNLITSSVRLYFIIDWSSVETGERTTINVSLTNGCALLDCNPIIKLYREENSGQQFIFKNAGINASGVKVANNSDNIMCTGFIPVQNGSTIQVIGRGTTAYPLISFYSSDTEDEFLSSRGYTNNITVSELPSGTKFIRCNGSTLSASVNNVIIDGEVYYYLDTLKARVKTLEETIVPPAPEPTPASETTFDFSDIEWSISNVQDDGRVVSGWNRATNVDAINVQGYDVVTIYNQSDFLCKLVKYKNDNTVELESDFASGNRILLDLKDVASIRILFKKSDNTGFTLEAFETAVANNTIVLKYYGSLYSTDIHDLSIGFQNIRKFSTDGNTPGTPDVTTYLPQWKESISKWLNQDFMLIAEWTTYFDRNQEYNAYDILVKQFYPYYIAYAGGALFSKVPCRFSTIKIGYWQLIARLTLNNKEVAIVYWTNSNQVTPQVRMNDYSKMIAYLADFDIAIVAGDFNNDAGAEELAVWTQAGYTLGNNGYWGQIDTCTTSTNPNFAAIDNIITKGVIFDSFEKGNAIITSDHYPVRAKLKY